MMIAFMYSSRKKLIKKQVFEENWEVEAMY